jgi:hypothetical protein
MHRLAGAAWLAPGPGLLAPGPGLLAPGAVGFGDPNDPFGELVRAGAVEPPPRFPASLSGTGIAESSAPPQAALISPKESANVDAEVGQ